MPNDMQSRVAQLLDSELAMKVPEEHFGTPLVDVPDCYYDSLKVLEVITLLEKSFAVEIDLMTDDVQVSLSSIRQIAALLTRKRELAQIL